MVSENRPDSEERKDSILIVDDQTEILETLKEWFVGLGYDCMTVRDSSAALDEFKKKSFDIMLADIVMPGGIDGLELTRQAKNIAPRTQIIVMTGFSSDFSYDHAIEAGASDFIKKPFHLPELMARIRLVKMHQAYRDLSITDDLTGLYNRRGFLTLADHLLKLSIREHRGMFLLYADVDDLKWINDTFGHQEGDRMLVEFGRMLRQSYRQSDIVARVGGDEFIVFPVGEMSDCVDIIISRLEYVIASFNAAPKRPCKLSVSYGVSYFDPDRPCSLLDLVSMADKEMYRQKYAKKAQRENQQPGSVS